MNGSQVILDTCDSLPQGGKLTAKKKGPRSTYNEAIATEILRRITDEGKGLREACAGAHMPNESTVRGWTETNKEFGARYERARRRLYERWADEINTIADQARSTMADVQKARLQVDTRKWLLSKLVPHTYGDRIETINSGQQQVLHLHKHQVTLAGKSDQELAQIYRERLTRADDVIDVPALPAPESSDR